LNKFSASKNYEENEQDHKLILNLTQVLVERNYHDKCQENNMLEEKRYFVPKNLREFVVKELLDQDIQVELFIFLP
jgi:hypothetical protein